MNDSIYLWFWNIGLSIVMGIIGFWAKEKASELQRISILLNKTREEVARDNVTNAEVDRIMQHIDQRFNKLESKIDQLIQGKINA
jgi:KaiC/GvpD/RAD55 family RecA-like ATPase